MAPVKSNTYVELTKDLMLEGVYDPEVMSVRDLKQWLAHKVHRGLNPEEQRQAKAAKKVQVEKAAEEEFKKARMTAERLS